MQHRHNNFYCCKCKQTTAHEPCKEYGTFRCCLCDTVKYPSQRFKKNDREKHIEKHDILNDPPEFNSDFQV